MYSLDVEIRFPIVLICVAPHKLTHYSFEKVCLIFFLLKYSNKKKFAQYLPNFLHFLHRGAFITQKVKRGVNA